MHCVIKKTNKCFITNHSFTSLSLNIKTNDKGKPLLVVPDVIKNSPFPLPLPLPLSPSFRHVRQRSKKSKKHIHSEIEKKNENSRRAEREKRSHKLHLNRAVLDVYVFLFSVKIMVQRCVGGARGLK